MSSPSSCFPGISSLHRPRIGSKAGTMRMALPVFQVPIFAAIFAAVVASLSPLCAAQPPANNAPLAPLPLSASLNPTLEAVHRSLNGLRLEKWKKGTIREDANNNIGEILRDLEVNLPPLLHQADAAPGTMGKVLPVSRNLNALYDVLLRVVVAAQVAAPDDQAAQLQQTLASLGSARLALEDRMQGSADEQEKQIADLHNALRTQAARSAATIPASTPCVPPSTHRTTRKTSVPPAKAPVKKPAPGTPVTPATPSSSK